MNKFIQFRITDTVKPLNFYLDKIKAAFYSLGLPHKCLSCGSDGIVWVRVELTLNFFTQVYQNDPDTPFNQGIENKFKSIPLHPNIFMVEIQDEWPEHKLVTKDEDII